jgi:type VI secretion system protein ImpH
MATTPRATASALESDLLANAHQFSFFQVMRLLGILVERDAAGRSSPGIRVRPELSLAFPPAEVAGIEKTAYGYLVTVTFLGLYGPDNPLPTYYTEHLLEEMLCDLSVRRDFLDVINQRVYELLYQGLCKYRLPWGERGAELERLCCLMGLVGENWRRNPGDLRQLLPYAGLLAMRTRSALGLTTLLKGVLEVPVSVVECVECQVPIPPDQVVRLGSRGASLGSVLLGEEVATRSGKFRVRLGPLDRASYEAFLPGAVKRRTLESLVDVYVKAALVWDLEIVLAPGEAAATTLGSGVGGRLGWDSWLAPDEAGSASVRFTI